MSAAGEPVFAGDDRAIGLDARTLRVAGDGRRRAPGRDAAAAAPGRREPPVRDRVCGSGPDGRAASGHDAACRGPGARGGGGPPAWILPPPAVTTVRWPCSRSTKCRRCRRLRPLEAADLTAPVRWQERASPPLEPALPYLVLGWLVGVFGLSAWHLGGWAQLQRFRRRMVREAGDAVRRTLDELLDKAGRPPRGEVARIGARRGPDRRRLAAAGDPAAGQCPDRPEPRATGGDPRPRAGPHPPVRLPRQHPADGGRDPRLLSPGRLVGLAAASASSGRTAATTWPSKSAATRCSTPGP